MAKILKGKIVSAAKDKTVLVEVTSFRAHPLYQKRVRKTKKFKAHYEGKDLKLGDTVELLSTRPLSKDKHFKIKI
ncbi:30S ribosomal protein S17 [Candidatus Gottesmanbacteria bacterium RIFCSPHIGHO2_01_FULL_39_10]|uniref:30S ribosomal protein S17 n=1 Tax=Candidatus Gottesmanbacteria bacterium RIFCSPHIGHO2_01_FULL_39_10 TaxID=1798375 RepID=A0A1F5ZRI2_9BACT|nr:MAG: 30S ribosomal protein S17 [Candidatus Gottesmanbacteria bacterium RIFCSPHIGHO2_01_FULL_39_10]